MFYGNLKKVAYASAFASVAGTRLKAAKTGYIYLRINPNTGRKYVGRASSSIHYKARQWSYNLKYGMRFITSKPRIDCQHSPPSIRINPSSLDYYPHRRNHFG